MKSKSTHTNLTTNHYPIGVAILGCAHIHTADVVSVLKECSNFKVYFVWDSEFDRATACAKELGSKVAENVTEVLASEYIQAVFIESETHLHETLIQQTLYFKKHFFVEKPLAITIGSLKRLANTITNEKLIFHSGYFLRELPAMQKTHEFIRAKKL